jgi:hypothetical protein
MFRFKRKNTICHSKIGTFAQYEGPKNIVLCIILQYLCVSIYYKWNKSVSANEVRVHSCWLCEEYVYVKELKVCSFTSWTSWGSRWVPCHPVPQQCLLMSQEFHLKSPRFEEMWMSLLVVDSPDIWSKGRKKLAINENIYYSWCYQGFKDWFASI